MDWFKIFSKYVLMCVGAILAFIAFFGVVGGFAALVIAAAKVVGAVVAVIGAIIIVIVVICGIFATSDWLSERSRN